MRSQNHQRISPSTLHQQLYWHNIHILNDVSYSHWSQNRHTITDSETIVSHSLLIKQEAHSFVFAKGLFFHNLLSLGLGGDRRSAGGEVVITHTMKVFVKTLKGTHFEIEVSTQDKVWNYYLQLELQVLVTDWFSLGFD